MGTISKRVVASNLHVVFGTNSEAAAFDQTGPKARNLGGISHNVDTPGLANSATVASTGISLEEGQDAGEHPGERTQGHSLAQIFFKVCEILVLPYRS